MNHRWTQIHTDKITDGIIGVYLCSSVVKNFLLLRVLRASAVKNTL